MNVPGREMSGTSSLSGTQTQDDESYDRAMEMVEANSSLAEGHLAFERRQFELAIQHYEQACLLFEQLGEADESLQTCLSKLVQCYTSLNQPTEAEEANTALKKLIERSRSKSPAAQPPK